MAKRDWDDDEDGPWDGVEVYCRECSHRFRVPPSLQGGLANCPSCRRTTPVAGGPEPLFWVLLGAGILLVLAIASAFFLAGEITGGVIALFVGAAILLVVLLAS